MKHAHLFIMDFCHQCLAECTVSPHFVMFDESGLAIGHATLSRKHAELLVENLQMIVRGRKPQRFAAKCLPHEASQGDLPIRLATHLELRKCTGRICTGARFIFIDKKGPFAEAHPGKIDWIITDLQNKFSRDLIGATRGTA